MEDVQEPVVELEHAHDGNKGEKDTAVLVAKLPCSRRLQDLSLTLGKARLTVPIAITRDQNFGEISVEFREIRLFRWWPKENSEIL
jgi:hypothetical protein